MLIDFTVRNFRSIGEEVELSMIASSDKSLRSNVIDDPAVLKRRNLALLKSAVLYGGNASGKTSICRALDCMQDLIESSATGLNEGDRIPGIAPFRLRKDLESEPTHFEARVLVEGNVYRYGFEATSRLIEREWLYVTGAEPRSREVMLFSREGQDKAKWEFGASFQGNKSFLRAQTRAENCLILSKAPQESFTQLGPLYDWFAHRLKVLNMAQFPSSLEELNAKRGHDSEETADCLARIAQVADVGVYKTEARTERLVFPEEIRKAINSAVPDSSYQVPAEMERNKLFLLRRQNDTGESVRMSIDGESSGTRRFLVVAQLIIDAFLNGDTVVLDEFEASLHVLLTKDLLSAINDLDVPGVAAQFILATHDTNLLDLSALRRDQVFMVERNNQQTEVFSLYDLTPVPKTDASLERQYLADRFGGIPKLGNLRLVIADAIMSSIHGERVVREEEQEPPDEDYVLPRGRGH